MDTEEPAEGAVGEGVPQGCEGRVEAHGVGGHEADAGLLAGVDHGSCVFFRGGQGLFAQDVCAGGGGLFDELPVPGVLAGDDDRLGALCEDLFISCPVGDGELIGQGLAAGRVAGRGIGVGGDEFDVCAVAQQLDVGCGVDVGEGQDGDLHGRFPSRGSC